MTASKSVLLVEDEVLIALDVKDLLEGAGYRVLGPATTLDEARDLAERDDFDVAVLDVALRSKPVWPVAKRLIERGIPYVFLSGFVDALYFPSEFDRIPALPKPADGRRLLAELQKAEGRARLGKA